MFIFHKTEVQMVILRRLTGLNPDCFKSYDLRCSLKMTVWISVFWQMNIHIAKKWPEMVVKQSFMRDIRFETVFTYLKHLILGENKNTME